MKKMIQSVRGVTLLEVMLVLAIAAMIIVMSVRYYQSAQSSSSANAFVSQVQSITAAAENLASSTGFTASAPAASSVTSVLPTNGMVTPWGGTITYTPAAGGFSLGSFGTPATNICTLITAKFANSPKYTIGANCVSVSYTANQ